MNPRVRLILQLATRNVRRQARRSVLTALAMVLGVAVLAFARTLGDGGHEDWIDAGVRLGTGHIALQAPRFQASRNLNDRLGADARARATAWLREPWVRERVVAVAPRLEIQGLASSAAAAVPIMVTGVDPAIETEFSRLGDNVIEGAYLSPDDRLHAFVGERLASRLELQIGSRLVLSAQDASGEIASQLVRVAGIFRIGLPEADAGMVQIPIRTAREWLGLGDDVTTLAVLLESGWVVDEVLRDLRGLAAGDAEVAVVGWREAMPELDAAIRMDDWGDYVFNFVLYGIITLAIVNTVLMSVLYRTREFGVLQALGLTRGQTAAVVVTEGMILTAVSGLVGLGLGLGLTWLLFRNGLDYSAMLDSEFTFSGVVLDPVIIPAFRWQQVGRSLVAIAVVGTLASLYPAYRATRIDVAEATKFEA
ncbi:MAG TPA: FtsX-like permease family protein [Gemmatimonadales bacterium]|jgi:ABC-type lipoprotein release transport system permease subunit